MRCSVKGCNVISKHPQKAMCWKKFNMCKYHAYEFHPEIYEGSSYRPSSNKFMEICRRIENG